MEAIVTIAAATISGLFVVWTVWFNLKQAQTLRLTNLAHLIGLERSIAEIPTVFRFHGISEAQIKEAGLTPQELAYLVASTTAGGVYHMTHARNVIEPFQEGSYRHAMCASLDFRRAWPLIKIMMNESGYIQRIDSTIAKTIETL